MIQMLSWLWWVQFELVNLWLPMWSLLGFSGHPAIPRLLPLISPLPKFFSTFSQFHITKPSPETTPHLHSSSFHSSNHKSRVNQHESLKNLTKPQLGHLDSTYKFGISSQLHSLSSHPINLNNHLQPFDILLGPSLNIPLLHFRLQLFPSLFLFFLSLFSLII